MKSNHHHGFTLIELLVVMGLIALLASLLLPALARAKAKAHAAACLSNVKQWSLAFWMYEDDNDDFFPYEGAPFQPLDSPANAQAWYNSTADYLSQPTLATLYQQGQPPIRGQKSLFVCPCARSNAAPTLAKPVFYYGFNNRMDPNGTAQYKRTDIRFVTDTVTFTEGEENQYPSCSGVYTPARHERRATLGFADAHAAVVAEVDFRRRTTEDNSIAEFSKPRTVYWWPYPGAQ